jgi:glucan phosphoethanolaminetransferase (alkaline phosphatase superfamily)
VSDFQWREKIRKVQNSTKEESQVPERAKSLGFGCFTMGMMLMCLFFAIITIGMFAQSHPVIGTVSMIIALGISYMTYQLIRADKLP